MHRVIVFPLLVGNCSFHTTVLHDGISHCNGRAASRCSLLQINVELTNILCIILIIGTPNGSTSYLYGSIRPKPYII